MKRTLIAILASALMAGASACSEDKTGATSSESTVKGKRGPHGKRGRRGPAIRAGRLQKRLGLSAEQTEKFEAALDVATTREEQRKALEEILTPEQLAQYKEMMAGRRSRRGERDGRGFRAPKERAAWMQKELGLTDEVTAKVETALQNSKSRDEMIEALEGILTPEQLAKHRELMSKRRGRFGPGGRRGGPSPSE